MTKEKIIEKLPTFKVAFQLNTDENGNVEVLEWCDMYRKEEVMKALAEQEKEIEKRKEKVIKEVENNLDNFEYRIKNYVSGLLEQISQLQAEKKAVYKKVLYHAIGRCKCKNHSQCFDILLRDIKKELKKGGLRKDE